MKKLVTIPVILILLFTGCKDSHNKKASADSEFQRISQEYTKGYLDWRPDYGVYYGFHEYDGQMTDYSKASIDAEISRLQKYDQLLNQIDTTALSAQLFYDYRILRNAVKNEIFNLVDQEPFTTNPMTYARALDVSIYIQRNFAPLEDRIQSIIEIEKQAPMLYAAARQNLRDSLAKPFITLAIQNTKGNIAFLKDDLVSAVSGVKNDSLLRAFKAANDQTISELNSFVEFLEKEKLPKAHTHYALGADKMYKMLQYNGINIRPEKILVMGMKELEKEKEAFNATAKIINPNKTPAQVLLELQKEHPLADHLISDSRNIAEFIHQFIIDKKIITFPSEKRAIITETPQFLRSTVKAQMTPPGPFEKKATDAYFFITPVDPAWNDKQKEEWLSMFDNYTTSIQAIHEAYPGHYTQFMHLNASDATQIEKIFDCYSFSEGWAHYAEKMMLEEGFGNTGDPIKAAKYKLAQLNESIVRLCRLCVSIETHCNNMQVDEATRFFMNNWQQGEVPSRLEAMRGTFDPGYLFYSLGKWELLKLREDYKKQEGANFSLQQFHDQLLDYGMPPIILLRERLLKDKNLWKQIL